MGLRASRPNERLLLHRLSVFAGELSIDAAEVVCAGDGIRSADVLGLLSSLVDKSIVVVEDHADEARCYHLLGTIRQYARDRLDASAEARPDGRHRMCARSAAVRGAVVRRCRTTPWAQRDRLRRLCPGGLAALGAHLVGTRAYPDAVVVYRRLVHTDPWDEAAHRQLMSALARAGQRGEALRQYDRVEALLAKEFGSVPARETVELYDQIRSARVDG